MTRMAAPPLLDRRLPLLVAAASLASLAVAFASQYWGGLQPCVLCIYQRYPYAIAAALGIIGAFVAGRPGWLRFTLLVAGLVFLADAGIAAYHVGVEQHWWQGTAECGSSLDFSLSVEELKQQLEVQPVVRCDEIPWSLFGVSMAGFNFLYAAACGVATLWIAARGRAARFA
jgi:disulfide bond formation protein DsbB